MCYFSLLLAMTICTMSLLNQSALLTQPETPRMLSSWHGDIEDFVIVDDTLVQLNADSGGRSLIWTPVDFIDSISWEFHLQMDFSPSASNMVRLFLMVDSIRNDEPYNGYALQIGRNGSDDPVEFHILESSTGSYLAESRAIETQDRIDIHLAIERNAAGHWYILERTGTSTELLMELDEQGISPRDCNFFALECIYTATRRDQIALRNPRINELKPDTSDLLISGIDVMSQNRLAITFNKTLQAAPSADQIQFNPANIAATSITRLLPNTIEITTSSVFTEGESYTLTIRDAIDFRGDTTGVLADTFTFYSISVPTRDDIVINEILVDPSPSYGLPESEYIELWNSTKSRFRSEELTLCVNGKCSGIEPAVIQPGSHILLVDLIFRME